MGLIMMLSMLPGVLLGPLAGTIVDNYCRKKIIVTADILSGLFVLLLAALMLFAPHATRPTVVWLTVVSIALGVIAAVFRPAVSASIPDLVPAGRVAAANSLNQSSMQVSMLIGQGLGGVLFRLLGAGVLFLADGISYFI